MYQFAVSFTVPEQHRDDFVRAAHRTSHDSVAQEPGSLRLDVVADDNDPGVFHLIEAYTDAEAFRIHAEGPSFASFFADVSRYASGPTWLFTGSTPTAAEV